MKLWIYSNLQEQEAGSLQSAYAFKDSLFHFVYKIFNVFLVIETSFFQRFFYFFVNMDCAFANNIGCI